MKLCRTCRYGSEYELDKPCVVYRDDCPLYEKAESDHKCHNCKHYMSGEQDGSCDSYICEHYSNWESEE